MTKPVFYTPGSLDALCRAKAVLAAKGCCFAETPDSTVTHLLLGVPTFEKDGTLKGGGDLDDLLATLPPLVTVVGGMLRGAQLAGYKTIDLLADPIYTAENADITAHCAVRVALERLPVILKGCHILVIGWGRIGKCLAALLQRMGAVVTVAARKEADRAMLLALGYDTLPIEGLGYALLRYRVIFNTVPQPILSKEAMGFCSEDCIKIDLASIQGMAGEDVLLARGLPGKIAPESAGRLIAKTVLRLI